MYRFAVITPDGNPEHRCQSRHRHNQRKISNPGRHAAAARFYFLFFYLQLTVNRQFVKDYGRNDEHQRPARLLGIRTYHRRHAVNCCNQTDNRIKHVLIFGHFGSAQNFDGNRRIDVRQQRHNNGNRRNFSKLLCRRRRHCCQHLQCHNSRYDGQTGRRYAAAVDPGKNVSEQSVVGSGFGCLSHQQRPTAQRPQTTCSSTQGHNIACRTAQRNSYRFGKRSGRSNKLLVRNNSHNRR